MKNIFGILIIICIFGCTNYQGSRSTVDLAVYEGLRKQNDSLRLRLVEVQLENMNLKTNINY